MKPIATLKNLSLTAPHKKLFENVQLTINEGDKIGLLGLNGHGKSSLMKVLAETATPDTTVPPFEYDKSDDYSYFYVPQELSVDDEKLSIDDFFYEFYPEMKTVKKKIDLISEELASEGLSSQKMEKLIDEQGTLYDRLDQLGEGQIHTQYISFLKTFGLDDFSRQIGRLSGGEQRKVALSLGLSSTAKLILWDEPTNHLDLESVTKFEDELKSSQKTFLLISHDRTLLEHVCTRIFHIQQGKLISFNGGYQTYLNYLKEKAASDEKILDKLSNKHRRELAWMRQGVKARGTRSKKRVESYRDLEKEIEHRKQMRKKEVSLSLEHSGRKTKELVVAKEIGLQFKDLKIFSNLNFTICKGDKIALMGKNGAGKSSLLKAITGEIEVSSGGIKRAHELVIGHFSQKREALSLAGQESLTPWEWIGEGQEYVFPSKDSRRHIASYLEDFLFNREELRRPIETFSGGEKNRLQLAKFMSRPSDIWIFDEPTNDLDLETIGILEQELSSYEGALIIVSHDRSFLSNTTKKCWLLQNGEIDFFESGFDQAQEYLENLSLIEEQKKRDEMNAQRKKKNQSEVKVSKEVLNNHQVEQIESEIIEVEGQIESLQNDISALSTKKLEANELSEIRKKESDLIKLEEKLQSLWREL